RAPQLGRELFLHGAREARQLRERERTAARARDRLLDLAADELGEPLRARTNRRRVLLQHPQDRDPPRVIALQLDRPFQCRERELVCAQRALQRVTTQALDEIRATDDDPGLRPTEQLVAGEADEIGSGGERLARGRLVADVDERTRAEVV